MLFAVALVLVPFLFWRGTWFGRRLTNEQTAEYLANSDKPRRIQHALSQIADRIVRGDPSARQWYPRVVALGASPVTEIRVTAAWVMGQDNRAQEFHQALVPLLGDPEPMVRRNAALSLVRFGDGRGKHILMEMLRPFVVAAPRTGTLSVRLKEQDTANVGTLLARISSGAGETAEVRSLVPGQVKTRLRQEGAPVSQGDPILELAPSPEQVWEALRGLYLVGTAEDLPEVEPYASARPGMSEKIREQARLTAQAIRNRAAANPPRR